MRNQMVKIFHNLKCETPRTALSLPQRGAFSKEDGEIVINEKGLRV
jgi:hypothetical protein